MVCFQYHVKTKTVHFCYLGKQNQVDMKCVFINWLYKPLCCFCYHSREENKNCVWGKSELPFRILCSEINLPADLWRPYNLIARITLITKTQSWLLLPVPRLRLCDHKSAGMVFTADHLLLWRWMRPCCEDWSDVGIFYWHLCKINSVCSLFSTILSWSDGREASIWCQPNWILSSTNDIFNVSVESLSSGLALCDQFDKKYFIRTAINLDMKGIRRYY